MKIHFSSTLLRASALVFAGALGFCAHASTLTRTSSFAYDAATGLLLTETVEPDSPQLCVTTTYTYDAYGNKLTSSIANCAGASGSAVFASRAKNAAYATQTVTVQGVPVTIPAGAFATSSTTVNPSGSNLGGCRDTGKNDT